MDFFRHFQQYWPIATATIYSFLIWRTNDKKSGHDMLKDNLNSLLAELEIVKAERDKWHDKANSIEEKLIKTQAERDRYREKYHDAAAQKKEENHGSNLN